MREQKRLSKQVLAIFWQAFRCDGGYPLNIVRLGLYLQRWSHFHFDKYRAENCGARDSRAPILTGSLI